MQNFEWISIIMVVITMTATTIIYHERRYSALELKISQMISRKKCAVLRRGGWCNHSSSPRTTEAFTEKIDRQARKCEQ